MRVGPWDWWPSAEATPAAAHTDPGHGSALEGPLCSRLRGDWVQPALRPGRGRNSVLPQPPQLSCGHGGVEEPPALYFPPSLREHVPSFYDFQMHPHLQHSHAFPPRTVPGSIPMTHPPTQAHKPRSQPFQGGSSEMTHKALVILPFSKAIDC